MGSSSDIRSFDLDKDYFEGKKNFEFVLILI